MSSTLRAYEFSASIILATMLFQILHAQSLAVKLAPLKLPKNTVDCLRLGIAAVKRINALGALVDVSQLSKAATLQVLELTSSPIIASHSNAKTVSDVTRNLSDEEIDRIGENGGVIHVAAFKGYLINISEPEFIEKLVALRWPLEYR